MLLQACLMSLDLSYSKGRAPSLGFEIKMSNKL